MPCSRLVRIILLKAAGNARGRFEFPSRLDGPRCCGKDLRARKEISYQGGAGGERANALVL